MVGFKIKIKKESKTWWVFKKYAMSLRGCVDMNIYLRSGEDFSCEWDLWNFYEGIMRQNFKCCVKFTFYLQKKLFFLKKLNFKILSF